MIYITIEAENGQYENTHNSIPEITEYMESQGFVRHHSPHTQDPTYFNSRFTHYVKEHPVKIFQNG